MMTTTRPPGGYEFPCQIPGCKGGGKTANGLAIHMSRTHGNGNAPTEDELAAADAAWDRIIAASKVLFPDPDDAYRHASQIAEMQQLMKRALLR